MSLGAGNTAQQQDPAYVPPQDVQGPYDAQLKSGKGKNQPTPGDALIGGKDYTYGSFLGTQDLVNGAKRVNMGGSEGKSQSWLPGSQPYIREFEPLGNYFLNRWTPDGGDIGKSGQREILNTASGKYLDPRTNSPLARTLLGIGGSSADYLNKTMPTAGNGTDAMSVANRASLEQQHGLAQKDINDQLIQTLLGSWTGEKSNQLTAAGQATKQADDPFEKALQIANLFGGMGQSRNKSTPSLLGYVL